MESQAVLIANPAILRDKKKKPDIDRLSIRLRGSLEARGKRYLMMNAPVQSISRIKEILPSLKSPTIVPLADPNLVAVPFGRRRGCILGRYGKIKKSRSDRYYRGSH